jgi:hypothetical protein
VEIRGRDGAVAHRVEESMSGGRSPQIVKHAPKDSSGGVAGGVGALGDEVAE